MPVEEVQRLRMKASGMRYHILHKQLNLSIRGGAFLMVKEDNTDERLWRSDTPFRVEGGAFCAISVAWSSLTWSSTCLKGLESLGRVACCFFQHRPVAAPKMCSLLPGTVPLPTLYQRYIWPGGGRYFVYAQTAQLPSQKRRNEWLAPLLSMISFPVLTMLPLLPNTWLWANMDPANRHTEHRGLAHNLGATHAWEVPRVLNILKSLCHFSSYPQNFSLSIFPKRILSVYLVMSMSVSITNAIKTFFLAKLVTVTVCQSKQDHEEVHLKQVFLCKTFNTFF